MRRHPTAGEYSDAIQVPAVCFRDPALLQAAPVLDKFGIPEPLSGSMATVFRLRLATEGVVAVRCFLSYWPETGERYRRVGEYLERVASQWKTPFRFLVDGITVNGEAFPLLVME